ncbi:MAG: DUF1329 domain-containing protein [Nevskia sp.]|nr:DUF1329 domain-containing protein [Nevskia sp.]
MRGTALTHTFIAAAFAAASACASAKAPADKLAQLDGPQYTCMGAERAGSNSGVAAYTGKFLGGWPGLRNVHGYDPGPYAAERPLYTVTAQNLEQYAAQLGEGQKALLRKYPQGFRLPVYPSHRDFRYPDRVCAIVKQNAATAVLRADGLATVQALGGIPFPFPQNGLEAVYNTQRGAGEWNDAVTYDIADVYANGSIAWGRTRLRVLVPANDPKLAAPLRSPEQEVLAWFYYEQLLPERDKGIIASGDTPDDYQRGQLNAWVYNPGLRRVKQAIDVGADYAVPPAGLHTVDDESLFNGTPQHFDWKLLGKREMLVPYHAFKVNDPALKYAELIQPQTLNPDDQRYELHRVWVLEGRLKAGERHIYSRRTLYIDEDTWLPLWSDCYDQRGQLWRSSYVDYFYSPESQAFERGVIVYHDMSSGAYEAQYLVNESKQWWSFNDPTMRPNMFGQAALAHGH